MIYTNAKTILNTLERKAWWSVKNCKFVDNPVWGTEPYLITIGDHVLISGQVSFINHDGSTWCFREEGPYKDTFKFGPITIGNNCFIGYKSTILPNVSIGDNCVVAAGSMVNKSIPSGEVWGGDTRSVHNENRGLC